MNGFIIDSEECELLLAFEVAPNLEKLSETMGRDISNISRALTRMAGKLPVIEKKGGRWVLTDQGRKLNQHTRDSILYQRSLFQKQTWLRLGTNREFASRILGKNLMTLQTLLPETQIRICAFESGVEQALLDGVIDIGIDCERPFNPDVAYKLAITEPIVVVCSPSYRKAHSKEFKDEGFLSLPHLLCDRLSPDVIFKKSENRLNVLASFNDIATTRAACEEGLGWALLPRYAVQKELEQRTLIEITTVKAGESNYGVWWLRGRRYLEVTAIKMQDWLKEVDL
jgi:DNA-binding transcriptional LysR family regulator